MNELAYTIEEAAELMSIGRDSVYELLHAGRLRSIKIGRRRVISHADIENFLAAESTDQMVA